MAGTGSCRVLRAVSSLNANLARPCSVARLRVGLPPTFLLDGIRRPLLSLASPPLPVVPLSHPHNKTQQLCRASSLRKRVLAPVAMSSAASEPILALPTPTVEPAWLADHLGKVKVLDASWHMPAEKRNAWVEFQVLDASWHMPAEKRNAWVEFQQCRIPGALFFDMDAIADPTTHLPHMLPSEVAFSRAVSALGLSNSDNIVVYDSKGLFSAARAWWMFRAFGHDSVAVLDGGLPQWKALGLPLEASPDEAAEAAHKAAVQAVKDSYSPFATGDSENQSSLPFEAHLRTDLLLHLDQVLGNLQSEQFQILDARSSGRFLGTDPEPRPGLSSGSIPDSKNVPFSKVVGAGGHLLCPLELEAAFQAAGVQLPHSDATAGTSEGVRPLAVFCGTGVTACILALALFRLGVKDVPVYDGSWTEWASTSGVPIAKATPAA